MRITTWLAAMMMLLAPITASAAEGEIGIRLLEVPKGREDDPRARLYIVDHLDPGATITRKIEVSSGLDRPARVTLYAAGADVRAGTFRFFDGTRANELSSWTSVSPSVVELAAGAVQNATVRIAVPGDALDGERYAVVWAQIAGEGDGEVRTVSRVGIRIYLSVGEGAEPATDFTVESLTAARDADGRPRVSALVRNLGRRALDLNGELRLGNGPGGLSAGPFDAQLGTTLGVGETAPVAVVLDPVIPDGPWDARLTLRSGPVTRLATATITFPATPASTSTPVVAVTGDGSLLETPGGRALIAVAAALIIAVAVALLLLLVRRRRERLRSTG